DFVQRGQGGLDPTPPNLEIGLQGTPSQISRLVGRDAFTDDLAVRRPWHRVIGKAYFDPTQSQVIEHYERLEKTDEKPTILTWSGHGLFVAETRAAAYPAREWTAEMTGDVAQAILVLGDTVIRIKVLIGRIDRYKEDTQEERAVASIRLLNGSPETFFEFIRRILSDRQRDLSLVVGVDTHWASTSPVSPFEFSLKPLKISIDPQADAANALSEGLAACAVRLLQLRPALAAGRIPETARHARVALRRLRSFEKSFRPYTEEGSLREMAKTARRLARRIGAARDWDVFLDETLPASGVEVYEQTGAMALKDAAVDMREDAWSGVERAFKRRRFDLFLLDVLEEAICQGWRERGDASLNHAAQAFASRALDERLFEARRLAHVSSSEEIETLHDLRLGIKRFRYVAQMFRSAFEKDVRKPYFRALALLQTELGILNDAVVAERLTNVAAAKADPSAALAAGFICGQSTLKSQLAADRAIVAWKAREEVEPFWLRQQAEGGLPPSPADSRFDGLSEILKNFGRGPENENAERSISEDAGDGKGMTTDS
ncbi:MAG: CHAD domain-containing protein, partial [Pseudomonadota bacterium]